mmetsp:Transcript_47799/g.93894  ORF Transcript_47799/g.93894 Transcript_47799/m.93894 type:complete len:345 (-) Transcript_47799:69-1103(-)
MSEANPFQDDLPSNPYEDPSAANANPYENPYDVSTNGGEGNSSNPFGDPFAGAQSNSGSSSSSNSGGDGFFTESTAPVSSSSSSRSSSLLSSFSSPNPPIDGGSSKPESEQDEKISKILSLRPRALDIALLEINKTIQEDEKILSTWLLLQINHWNLLQERLVVITNESLYRIKYDFIREKIKKTVRVSLQDIKNLMSGTVRYKEGAFAGKIESFASGIQTCNRKGLRIVMAEKPKTFKARWNPFSTAVSSCEILLCSHMTWVQSSADPSTETELSGTPRSIDDFKEALEEALRQMGKQIGGVEENGVQVLEEDIILDSFSGVPAVFYNQSLWGATMDRGGIAF